MCSGTVVQWQLAIGNWILAAGNRQRERAMATFSLLLLVIYNKTNMLAGVATTGAEFTLTLTESTGILLTPLCSSCSHSIPLLGP